MKKNKKYTRAEVTDFMLTSYAMSVTPYYPICDSVVSDYKVDGVWQKNTCVAGYWFSTRSYQAWFNMRQRVKGGQSGKLPSYANTAICPEWASYEAFSDWCNAQPWFYLKDYQLDSDLLSSSGDKQYSPETCSWLPREVNIFMSSGGNKKSTTLPIGVYKVGLRYIAREGSLYLGTYKTVVEASGAYATAKHARATELAIKYDGLISPQAHNALLLKFAPKQRADSSDGVVQVEAVA
jgi:hypothetical protein